MPLSVDGGGGGGAPLPHRDVYSCLQDRTRDIPCLDAKVVCATPSGNLCIDLAA